MIHIGLLKRAGRNSVANIRARKFNRLSRNSINFVKAIEPARPHPQLKPDEGKQAMNTTIDHQTQNSVDDIRLDGVRTRRVWAFVIDAAIVFLLSIPVSIVIFLLGVVTLGLGFILYAVMFPLIAIGYVGYTMGGEEQATVGMRANDIYIAQLDGGRIDPMTAIVHSVLFWAANAMLSPFVLLVTLFSDRKRTLHDLLLGTIVLRRSR
jgi:uncharacterized RDD family membrane protein YckC